eukprot:TRINITY_DN3191_c0_g2_i9.p1 TRINITY_DN3191_c0_g2~~TRINITY_DN3191_c0_g2_i9.p1  ORF type:complete len:519 (+),score=71.80 TRINITY_DN3191_c0_g2_i9:284-1840(+)
MLTPSMRTSKEVFFSVEDPDFASDYFRMYEFKVKRCPRAKPHDWTLCPFSHPGEKAKRRDPKRYRYSGTACPEFRKSACCRRGDACPFAHGVFECWLHPARYRTQLCTDGGACKRRVCFFAHAEEELRKPSNDPLMLNTGTDVGLLGGIDMDKLQAMSHMLGLNQPSGGDTIPVGLPEHTPSPTAMGDVNQEILRTLTPGNSSPLPPPQGVDQGVNMNNSSIQTQIKMLQIQQQINELQELEKQQKESQARQQQLLRDVMTQLGDNQGGSERESAQLLQVYQQQQEANQLMGMVNTMQPQDQVNLLVASQPLANRLSPSPTAMPSSPTVQRSEHNSFTSQGSNLLHPVSVPVAAQSFNPSPSSPGLSPVPSSSQLIRPALSTPEMPQVSGSGQVDALINLLASQSDRQDDIGKLVSLLKAAGSVHPDVLKKIQEVLGQQNAGGAVSGGGLDVGRGGGLIQPMSSSLSTPSLPLPPSSNSPPVANIWTDAGDERLQKVLAAVKGTSTPTQHTRNASLES